MFSMQQLQHFITVAEARSFSIAAKKSYISQQTLSICIAQMEKEIGGLLFERTRPLTITSIGERLLQGAREIMQTNTLMQRDLIDMTNPGHNAVRVGVSHAHARTSIVSILAIFEEKCPHSSIKIRELKFEDMWKALKDGTIDIALIRPPYASRSIKYVPIADSDDLYLYAPWKTLQKTYGDRAQEIRRKLEQSPSLSVVQDAPLSIPAEGTIRDILLHYMAERGIEPNIKYETSSLETAVRICSLGHGITASPGRLLLPKTEDDSGPYSGRDCYLLKRNVREYALGIAYLSNVRISVVMQEFINAIRQYYRQ